MYKLNFRRSGVHTVYRKTVRWIKDDRLRTPRQVVFAIDLVLTTTCSV